MSRSMAALLLLLFAGGGAGCPRSQPDPAPDDRGDAGTGEGACADPLQLDLTAAHCGAREGLPSEVTLDAQTGALRFSIPGADLLLAAVEEGTLRVRYAPPGVEVRGRTPAVVAQPAGANAALRVGHSCDRLVACTSMMAVVARPATGELRVTGAAGELLLENRAEPIFTSKQLLPAGGVVDVFGVKHGLEPQDVIYGCGERNGPLDRHGRTLTFWNTDAYDAALGGYRPDADPLYQSIPFCAVLRGGTAFGLFADNSHRMTFDLGAADPAQWRVAAAGGALDHYVFAGPTLPEVLDRYTRLTGRPFLPPRWTLGYHQSRWGYPDAARIREIASGFRQRAIPADGIWLDIQHMSGFRSWTFDPLRFADPAGLISELSRQGFKTTVIVDPGIKVDPAWDVYSEGLAGGHFLRDAQGQVYAGEVWPGPSVFPDFSAPATRAWWASLVPRATSAGVRGIWLDMNEPANFVVTDSGNTVPNTLRAAGDGVPTTLAEVHNLYALHEARATWDGMRAAVPSRRPFLLSRAGYSGLQRYAAVWTGDAPSSWDTLAQVPAMLAGLGMSGVPFVGSDVGGYSGGASPELFARWMQVGSISPFFRGHVTENVPGQEPWAFGPEVEIISREAIRARYRLLPYLYSLFAQANAHGAPILRPLGWEFPHDARARQVSDQVMLGPSLLYAPVLAQGAKTRTLYLPEGRWFERQSGAAYQGPGEVQVEVTLAALPTFVRQGAILPLVPQLEWTDQRAADLLELEVYPGPTATSFTLYEDDGDSFAHEQGAWSRTTWTLQETPEGATLTQAPKEGNFAAPARKVQVRIRRVDGAPSAVTLSGAALPVRTTRAELEAAAAGWWWDPDDLALLVRFDDQPQWTLAASYEPALSAAAPPVRRLLRVRVPSSTPGGATVHVASSANGWKHQPLAWTAEAGVAEGYLEVPRGKWFEFKYSRGDWATVEKWTGCAEASNRYGFGAAGSGGEDRVDAWADGCP